MSDEIRRLLGDAFDFAPLDETLRMRVVSSLPARDVGASRSRFPVAAQLVAALLAVAVVAALLYAGQHASRSRTQIPATLINGCEIPVSGLAAPGRPQYGFLKVSDGTFTTSDPKTTTEITAGAVKPADLASASYDRALDLWLPVPATWVSPDGSGYVYLASLGDNGFSELRYRNLSDHTDTQLVQRSGISILGWGAEGLYFGTWSSSDSNSDLWVVDPSNRRQQHIYGPSQTTWWAVGGGAAWGSAPGANGLGSSNEIIRLDLKSKLATSWYKFVEFRPLGVDSSGRPAILQTPGEHSYADTPLVGKPYLVDSQGHAIAMGDDELPVYDIALIPDGQRIWFSATGQRLWLYTKDTGVVFIDETANTSVPNGMRILGGCR